MLTLLAANDPSRVPWYVAGGALALWAVILATIGLNRPEFPYSARGQAGVIMISLVLVVVAIAMAIITG
jgi:hypothetical protein